METKENCRMHVGAKKRKRSSAEDQSLKQLLNLPQYSPADSGFKEEASRSRKSSSSSEIEVISLTALAINGKSEEPRQSSRVKVIKKENVLISQLSSIDQKLLGLIKRTRKLKQSEDLEDARNKWLPFVKLSRIKPEIIFRLTDDWSFLSSMSFVKSITFLPKIHIQRVEKTESGMKQCSFVTWDVVSDNHSTSNETSLSSIFQSITQPPDEAMSRCLESLIPSFINNQGSWIDSIFVPHKEITVDVQNLHWKLKMFFRNHIVTKR